eukprot:3266611-Lingulodinium_polyedra.AAC.1
MAPLLTSPWVIAFSSFFAPFIGVGRRSASASYVGGLMSGLSLKCFRASRVGEPRRPISSM